MMYTDRTTTILCGVLLCSALVMLSSCHSDTLSAEDISQCTLRLELYDSSAYNFDPFNVSASLYTNSYMDGAVTLPFALTVNGVTLSDNEYYYGKVGNIDYPANEPVLHCTMNGSAFNVEVPARPFLPIQSGDTLHKDDVVQISIDTDPYSSYSPPRIYYDPGVKTTVEQRSDAAVTLRIQDSPKDSAMRFTVSTDYEGTYHTSPFKEIYMIVHVAKVAYPIYFK